MRPIRRFRALHLRDARPYWSVGTQEQLRPPRRRGRRAIDDKNWLKKAAHLHAAFQLGWGPKTRSKYELAQELIREKGLDGPNAQSLATRVYDKLSDKTGLAVPAVLMIWAWDRMSYGARLDTLKQIEAAARRRGRPMRIGDSGLATQYLVARRSRGALRIAAICKCLRLGSPEFLDCLPSQGLLHNALPAGARLNVPIGFIAEWAFETAFG